MSFQIPGDLSLFSAAGIKKLLAEAETEWAAYFTVLDPDTVTDDQLQYAEALQTFRQVDGPAALAAAEAAAKDQQGRADRLKNLTAATKAQPDGEEGEEEEEAAPEARPTMSQLATGAHLSGDAAPVNGARTTFSTLVAAAGVPNFKTGTHFDSMLDVAKAFEAVSAGHGSMHGPAGAEGIVQMTPVAYLKRDYPEEFTVNGDSSDQEKLTRVADEHRLPGGDLLASVDIRKAELKASGKRADSLVAAAGWCAPSEVDYSICMQVSTDGLADWPEVQARRGGIRHNTGLAFNSIFGGGTCATGTGPTGFFNLSESQVASGTTKTCLEIPCPSFTDTRLGVTGLCLTGNILSIRGYPEMTETFTRGAVMASAHQVNREQIATVVSGSTAIDLTSAAPWATDGSTLSQVLSAVDMAQIDIKYNLRMSQGSTLEVILPWWLLGQFRADWVRRPFVDGDGSSTSSLALADDAISAAFAQRGVHVQYVYDWQDAFATCAVSGAVGAATPINFLPKTLQFLIYPAGTWVRAVSDVITLNSVYDSTKLATNQVTHLFTEHGWAMLQMCPVSRVYTVPICPSGKTTSTGTLTCP